VKTTRAALGSTNVKIVRRRAFGPLVPIHERDACRGAPVVLGAAALVPGGLPGVPLPAGEPPDGEPPDDPPPDGLAVEEPDPTGVPADSAAPLTADLGVLTVGVDPPTVGVADPGFGTVGVGAGFGTVVEGVDGGFGTVTVGVGGGFGRVTVGIGSGRVGVVTVVVVTPGIGTLTARARPETRPIAANPTRTAAVLMSG
jgi:hypothetical protein